jgi:hypothetical protein
MAPSWFECDHRRLTTEPYELNFADQTTMSAGGATTMSKVVAGNVCYRATEKITYMADIGAFWPSDYG